MIGDLVLLVLIISSAKVGFGLHSHRPVFKAHGITSAKISALQLSLLLYVLSILAFAVPFSWLKLLAPIPLGLLLLAPGILLGRHIATRLDIGNEAATQASRVASNAFWLGLATLAFVVGNIVLRLIFSSVGG